MTKYALYEYDTFNIGDDIQSIAARRFIPKIDYYINRDSIGLFEDKENDEEIKMILNGWYMHSPYSWPPIDKNLSPLLLSMFIDIRDPKVKEVFFSDKSKKYFLNSDQTIGARDKATEKILQKQGIPSYFSGCVSLTLQKDEHFKRQEFILAVDISDEMYNYIKSHTHRYVIRMSSYFKADLTRSERFIMAEYFLFLYQTAHSIVTSRLHCVLPSLSFETPVLLIKTEGKYQKSRYSGLEDLVRHTTEVEYKNNYKLFDVDFPGENPKEYLNLRANLIKTITEYSQYDAAAFGISYTSIDFTKISWDLDLIQIFSKFIISSFNNFNKYNVLKFQKDKTENHINSSFSWKITKPVTRWFGRLIRKIF
ncbi:MAG: polysaccharide pyruvyl transferase family protein [Methanobrevibacter sp. CfCl-M3]